MDPACRPPDGWDDSSSRSAGAYSECAGERDRALRLAAGDPPEPGPIALAKTPKPNVAHAYGPKLE